MVIDFFNEVREEWGKGEVKVMVMVMREGICLVRVPGCARLGSRIFFNPKIM